MYKQPSRLLCSAFVRNESPIDTELSMKVGSLLGIDGQVVAVVEQGIDQRPRLLFRSSTRGLQVYLGGTRVDVSAFPTGAEDDYILDYSSFFLTAGNWLSKLCEMIQPGEKPTRLAAAREGMLGASEARKKKIAKNLLNIPPSMKRGIFEWDWRCASRSRKEVGRKREDIFSVITARRQSGLITSGAANPRKFDDVRADFDINTAADNISSRFGGSDIKSFFKSAVSWHGSLEKEFLALIDRK